MAAQAKPKQKIKDASSVASIFAFILLLSMGGLLSFVLPKSKVSEIEKRDLTQFPTFSRKAFFSGAYADSLDLYYADNFPFRDSFVGFSQWLKDRFGWTGEVKIYTTDAAVEAGDSTLAGTPDSVSVKKQAVADTARNKVPASAILIYKGAGFQMFRGSEGAVRDYAAMVNQYHKALGDSVKVYCLVAPSPIDFNLPMENKTKYNLEGPNIAALHANLDSSVVAVDAYNEIGKHKNEYLYFNTDHHWTARGAYYAYRAFCEAAGFEPVDLSQLKRKVRKNFIGSLYGMTLDARLRKNPDSIETFRLPVQTTTYRYPAPGLDSMVVTPLFIEMTNYLTFLGGDYPLIRVHSEAGKGRRVLVIKDSYGNAVCPFLAMHFEDVLVVDYRSFESNLLDFVKVNKITDVVFLHNTFIVNTSYTTRKELYLMKTRRKAPVIISEDGGGPQ